MEAEEQNFSLFNYVNDVNSEIERLEHSISGMRNQIEKYKGQDASSNTQRKKTVRDLEDRLTKTDKKAEDYESRYNLAVRTINQLKNGIQSIFTRIGATSASVDEMLGNQVRFGYCFLACRFISLILARDVWSRRYEYEVLLLYLLLIASAPCPQSGARMLVDANS
jgi:uncharacterized protein YoxC